MAKKNSAVLWTVGQSLEKGDKEQARHNMGISFESSTTLATNTLTFVDDIKEDATTGDLTFTKKNVTVDSAVTSTGKNPVSGEAVSTALNNLKTFYATTSNTFNELLTAYNNGQTLMFLADKDMSDKNHVYTLNWISKSGSTIDAFEFVAIDKWATSVVQTSASAKTESLAVDAWVCHKTTTPQWEHKTDLNWLKLATTEYADFNVSPTFQVHDVAIETGDKLLISDSSDDGKEVRSEIAFDTTASETSFLNQRGAWNTALPTYTESSDPLASNYWDNLSGTKFYTIKSSPTPANNNTSPEEGNMFALTGEFDRGSGNKYKVQLAMGDKLYYRHTTGTAGTTWSDWITLNEYSAGTDLVLQNNKFSVNTDSAIDDLSEAKRGFAIGEGNYMYNSDRSFLGGTQSYMYGGNSVFLLGDNCRAGDIPSDVTDPSTYSTLSYAFVYGNANEVASSNCLVVLGENNSIGKYNDTITTSGLKHGHNVIIGDNNNISGGKYNICMGSHNSVSFSQAQNSPSYTIMLGHDLDWNNPAENDLLILGRYNDTSYRYRSTGIHPIRITGCGTDSRGANIEELYPSGILWLQTGVEMHKTTGSFNYDSQLFMDRDGYAFLTISLAAQESVSGNDPDYSYNRKITDMGYVKRDSIGISAVTEITDIIADGGATIPSNSLQNVQLLNIKRPSQSPSGNLDYINACTLEFQDSVRCGVMGFAVSEPAIPSWNSAILSDLANSWFRIYANRINPDHPDIIKMPWEAIAGNLELGKLAVKFFSEDDFTQAHPLVPGAKVGDLTFITGNGDDTASSHTFWVQDSSHNGQPYQVANYIKANTFCILATRVASNFNTNPYTLGSFTALISNSITN